MFKLLYAIYVGETAQQLNIRFTTHRASMSGKLKSNFCKWLAEHILLTKIEHKEAYENML